VSELAWTVAGTVLAFLSFAWVVGVYAWKRWWERRTITYQLLASVPFLRNVPGIKSSGLTVIYHKKELTDPHLLEVQLTSKRHRDIPTSAFDQDRPLCIDVGAPIVALLEARYDPDQLPLPEITTTGSSLRIEPSLIRRRQDMRFFVLTEGPGAHLDLTNPLIDYTLREGKSYEAGADRIRNVKRIIGWAIVILIVWFLITNPVSAAHAITNLLNAL
jgi:hypothetical protein